MTDFEKLMLLLNVPKEKWSFYLMNSVMVISLWFLILIKMAPFLGVQFKG